MLAGENLQESNGFDRRRSFSARADGLDVTDSFQLIDSTVN
jgi:hypothetical protein